MGSGTTGAGATRDAAHSAAREAAPWIERLARLGYAAKGAVYVLIGGLALALVLGQGGQATGSSGALASVGGSTLGRAALGAIALGLAGYVVWRLVGAILNPENDSAGRRVFYLITGAVYGALGVEAARLALGAGRGGSGEGASHWSAQLMEQPFGQVLVGIVGGAIVVYGLQQIWDAWRVDLDDQLALGSMTASARRWTVRFSRLGLAARGGVLAVLGAYLLVAAIQADPSEARDVGGVLGGLRDTPWLLGIVALGLIGYGLYNFVRARYRVIRPA